MREVRAVRVASVAREAGCVCCSPVDLLEGEPFALHEQGVEAPVGVICEARWRRR